MDIMILKIRGCIAAANDVAQKSIENGGKFDDKSN